jgi:hypothetical protein
MPNVNDAVQSRLRHFARSTNDGEASTYLSTPASKLRVAYVDIGTVALSAYAIRMKYSELLLTLSIEAADVPLPHLPDIMEISEVNHHQDRVHDDCVHSMTFETLPYSALLYRCGQASSSNFFTAIIESVYQFSGISKPHAMTLDNGAHAGNQPRG